MISLYDNILRLPEYDAETMIVAMSGPQKRSYIQVKSLHSFIPVR